jgi:cold shock CspA family protein
VKAGFGFITRNDNGQDVYAHYTAITKKNPNHRVRSLADGEVVRFNIKSGSKGAEACDITAANGGPVQGSEYALPLKEKREENLSGQHQQQALNFPINNNSRYAGNQSNRNMMNNRGNRFPSDSRRMPSAPRTARSYQGNMNNFRGGRAPRASTRPVYEPSRNQMPSQVPMPPQQPAMMRYPKMNTYVPNQNINYTNNQQPAFGGMYSNMNQMQPNGNYNQSHQNTSVQPPTGTLIERRVQGSVKWYNYKNGFGFIVRNDNKQDIFVHNSGLQYHKIGLDDGEPVEFDVLKTTDRLLAVNVTGPNGNSLRGSKYAYNNSANMNNNTQQNRYNNEGPTNYRRRRN